MPWPNWTPIPSALPTDNCDFFSTLQKKASTSREVAGLFAGKCHPPSPFVAMNYKVTVYAVDAAPVAVVMDTVKLVAELRVITALLPLAPVMVAVPPVAPKLE